MSVRDRSNYRVRELVLVLGSFYIPKLAPLFMYYLLRLPSSSSHAQYTGTPAGNEDHDHRDVDTKGEAKGGSSGRRRSPWLFLKEEWDTLAWIAGALAVTYYTDFWFVVLHGEAVDR